jgi:hypothetical protein
MSFTAGQSHVGMGNLMMNANADDKANGSAARRTAAN